MCSIYVCHLTLPFALVMWHLKIASHHLLTDIIRTSSSIYQLYSFIMACPMRFVLAGLSGIIACFLLWRNASRETRVVVFEHKSWGRILLDFFTGRFLLDVYRHHHALQKKPHGSINWMNTLPAFSTRMALWVTRPAIEYACIYHVVDENLHLSGVLCTCIRIWWYTTVILVYIRYIFYHSTFCWQTRRSLFVFSFYI